MHICLLVVLLNAAVIGVLMHEMPTVKASCQFLVGLRKFCFSCQQIVMFVFPESNTDMTFEPFVLVTNNNFFAMSFC